MSRNLKHLQEFYIQDASRLGLLSVSGRLNLTRPEDETFSYGSRTGLRPSVAQEREGAGPSSVKTMWDLTTDTCSYILSENKVFTYFFKFPLLVNFFFFSL